jgi:hypothetical protein
MRKLKEAWFFRREKPTREHGHSAFIHLESGFLSATQPTPPDAQQKPTALAGGRA